MSKSREILRRIIVREGAFLKQLFLSKSRSTTVGHLKKSQERQLNLLFRLFSHICKGTIPLKQEVMRSLDKKKKLHAFQQEFGSKIVEKTNAPRMRKLEVLKKFSSDIPGLLSPIFILLE